METLVHYEAELHNAAYEMSSLHLFPPNICLSISFSLVYILIGWCMAAKQVSLCD